MSNRIALITDCSVNPKSGLGVGSCLKIPIELLNQPASQIKLNKHLIIKEIKVKIFENTSSTQLEIKTAIWALEQLQTQFSTSSFSNKLISLYSDSNGVASLPQRREKLEFNQFYSKKTGKLLKNALLYKTFFKLQDQLNFEVIKVVGHMQAKHRNTINWLFSYVDSKARHHLKNM